MVGAGAALWHSANWHALFGGFAPFGARAELWNHTNGKRAIFRVFCKEMSSGQWKLIFRGMQWKYFQVLSLLMGHRMSPPMCGMGNGRDGDKLLCNRCPLKHEARERERGVKCFTRTCRLKTPPSENLRSEVQLMSQIHDIYVRYGCNHP